MGRASATCNMRIMDICHFFSNLYLHVVQALEIVNIIFAGLFILLEMLDVNVWCTGVYKRRKLMKANFRYKPAIYVIPGKGHRRMCVGGILVYPMNRGNGRISALVGSQHISCSWTVLCHPLIIVACFGDMNCRGHLAKLT